MDYLHNAASVATPVAADAFENAARSENTRVAYEKGWKCFTIWCQNEDLVPLEAKAEDVARFMVAMATADTGRKPLALNTLRLYRSGMNDRWLRMGMSSPASARIVNDVLRGLARILGDAPRRVKALREYEILAMLKSCGSGPHGLRDAALLSLGFAAALRRSEICALRTGDLERKGSEGMTVHVRQSKTDPQGTGQKVAVIEGKAVRPVAHVERWLGASSISEGFIFQTLLRGGVPSGRPLDPGDVARVVKRHAQRIGLDPQEYSGHSLRAGFVTSAAAHHARLDKIMEVTRHKSAEMVMKYIRDEESFVDHAGAAFL